jgi:hypothetical protein
LHLKKFFLWTSWECCPSINGKNLQKISVSKIQRIYGRSPIVENFLYLYPIIKLGYCLTTFLLFSFIIESCFFTCFIFFEYCFATHVEILTVWKRKILTVWKGKFWQFENLNFDSLKRKILTVWKGKFWQFEIENFDSLKIKILTVWKGNFWQYEKENFDSLKRKILTVWKGKFWQFKKEKFWQFGKGKFWQFVKENFDSL